MDMAFLARLGQLARLVREICALPVAQLRFDVTRHPEQRRMYELFTKPHPRFKFARNKTLGIALVYLHSALPLSMITDAAYFYIVMRFAPTLTKIMHCRSAM